MLPQGDISISHPATGLWKPLPPNQPQSSEYLEVFLQVPRALRLPKTPVACPSQQAPVYLQTSFLSMLGFRLPRVQGSPAKGRGHSVGPRRKLAPVSLGASLSSSLWPSAPRPPLTSILLRPFAAVPSFPARVRPR